MNLYVESSAIAARLLGQSKSALVEDLLERADNVFSSELLLVECDRALIRAETSGEFSAADIARQRAVLNRESAYWTLLRIEGEVLERARRPFPLEPVRSLDAVHLSTLLVVRSIFADAELLSFDDRIRRNATALGFELVEV
ncbi:MAG TPA: type II toxin-antitoxin system VapC family toxin [Gemmatimonadota bacterium]|nr:type II toxin-antitoxin system VapC family toxin [Gemmatimonadota bacterium]